MVKRHFPQMLLLALFLCSNARAQSDSSKVVARTDSLKLTVPVDSVKNQALTDTVKHFTATDSTKLRAVGDSVKALPHTDSARKYWVHVMIPSVNLSQTSFINWQTAGANSLTVLLALNGSTVYDGPQFNWNTIYVLNLGGQEVASLPVRKGLDLIDITTTLTYKAHEIINPYLNVHFTSQFITGYSYNDLANTKTALSAFMDPGYFIEGTGLKFLVIKQITTGFGFALTETYTRKYNQYTDDPATPEIEKRKIDGNLEWITDALFQFEKNVSYKANLDVLSPFKKLKSMKVTWSSLLHVGISKYLAVEFNLLLKEDPLFPKTQINEGLTLNFAYPVF